jgi:hypothetical protein
MGARPSAIQVYLEAGARRSFAGAIEWPGWCRSGKTEEAALGALAGYGPRYATVLRGSKVRFDPPIDASRFEVVERLPGDASTDFGVPGKAPSADDRPIDGEEIRRMEAILRASWNAFDTAVKAASGKELRKGPRGGGRDLDRIVAHVVGADVGYLARIGTKYKMSEDIDPRMELVRMRPLIMGAFTAVACGQSIPAGPRGGTQWWPRYFVRRLAWHVLDHAWEIEDRSAG